MFKKDWTSITDSERSGRSSTGTSDDKQEETTAMILTDRRITTRNIASALDISEGSAYSMVHGILGPHKVCVRWVPKELTEEHKRNRVDISYRLLERYCNEEDNFLNRIITGDEPWIHHCEPQSKRQSTQWKQSPAAKKFKTQLSAGELMLTVFWKCQGRIQERETTVTSERYSDILGNELRLAIHTKQRGILSEGVLFLHDNARTHTGAHARENLQELKFEVLDHLAYSSDLAPSDFHLFEPLKKAIRGRRFSDE
jgi:histone-lysine N-methyltransferase SETMAR